MLAKIREESALTPTLSRKREREQKPSPACGRGLGEGASAASGSTRIVHRMGDLGYFDADGRLWFCGRKSQRVVTTTGTLCTEQIEPVFNVHPEVRRTALVGVGERGAQRPVLRSEGGRVGKEGVRTCSTRGSQGP